MIFTKLFYDVTETCEMLNCSRSKYYELVNRGYLTPTKFGSKPMSHHEDIAACADRLRRDPLPSRTKSEAESAQI